MKLYTEEQVIQILYWMSPIYMGREQVEERIKKELTPIELPSDEDIEKLQEDNDNYDDYDFYDTGFKQGVKWMKEQILKQNK